MNRQEFIKIYWKQYQLLEKEFLLTDDYVSIDKDNYDTFSNQYLKLLLAICSEMDSIAEVLCTKDDENEKVPFGIKNKLDKLVDKFPNMKKYRINTKYPYDIKNITPLDKFSDSISDWWRAYNDIKHKRSKCNEAGRYNYTKANLKNVLFALAGLYILNIIVYYDLDEDKELSDEVLTSNIFISDLIL